MVFEKKKKIGDFIQSEGSKKAFLGNLNLC